MIRLGVLTIRCSVYSMNLVILWLVREAFVLTFLSERFSSISSMRSW